MVEYFIESGRLENTKSNFKQRCRGSRHWNGRYKICFECQKYDISFPIYIDMARSSYELFEFLCPIGYWHLYDFKAKQHFDKGFRQGSTQGSVLQQGGEALFDNGGIAFKNIAQKAGEHRDLEEILSSL